MMSAVKAALSKTESQFISLHEVLSRVCEADGCTYAEAATLLIRLLYPMQDEKEQLWKERRIEGFCFASSKGIASGLNCLRQAAINGEPYELPF